MTTLLLPTATCFDDAIDYISERVTHEPALAHGRTLRLVHAIVLMPEDHFDPAVSGAKPGEPFAHAWAEENGHVYDAKLLNGERVYVVHERSDYYARMRVQTITRYTVRQVWRENKRTRHYGPWKAEYLALVKNGETP